MKITLILLILLSLCGCETTHSKKQENKEPQKTLTLSSSIKWSLKNGESFLNENTGVYIPKKISNFNMVRENLVHEDGSASFAFNNDLGLVTAYLSHKYSSGYYNLESKDVYEDQVNTFLDVIKNTHGEFVQKQTYSLNIKVRDNTFQGKGVEVFIPNFKKLNKPMHSFIFVYEINDFLYYFRASSLSPNFKDSFMDFISAIESNCKLN